jgi:two-component system, OmpR family, sensor histidine kinase VanS
MFKSIKMKLTAITLTILFLVFGIQLAANYLFAETFYVHRKYTVMEKAYEMIGKTIDKTNDQLLDIIGIYEDNNNLQFTIANKDLKAIYNSKQYSFDVNKNKYKIIANFNFKDNVDKFTKNAKPILKEKKNNNDILILYGLIERNQDKFYVLIRTPLKAIKEDMYETNLFILYVSAVALISGVLIVYLFAKRISKPIEEIDLIALNVTNLDFSKRVRERDTNDEIGRLSKNINSMADRLEATINELTTVNQELENEISYKTKIDEMRKDFVANVSHELKTPLAVLNGYTEILKDDIPGIDKEYYYDVILDEIQNMSNLVHTLLTLSSMENNLTQIEFEDVNITELVSNVLFTNNILFLDKNLDYNFEADEHFYVLANRIYLEQAVTNYLTNAMKHAINGSVIQITIVREKKNIVVKVFNEGDTISSDEINLIWDRFYRSDKARTRNINNNIGMGLYFVRAIMNAHHGKYGVNNREIGVEFWFSLEEI